MSVCLWNVEEERPTLESCLNEAPTHDFLHLTETFSIKTLKIQKFINFKSLAKNSGRGTKSYMKSNQKATKNR